MAMNTASIIVRLMRGYTMFICIFFLCLQSNLCYAATQEKHKRWLLRAGDCLAEVNTSTKLTFGNILYGCLRQVGCFNPFHTRVVTLQRSHSVNKNCRPPRCALCNCLEHHATAFILSMQFYIFRRISR